MCVHVIRIYVCIIRMYIHTCTYTNIHTNTHTCTHIRMYVHVHIRVYRVWVGCWTGSMVLHHLEGHRWGHLGSRPFRLRVQPCWHGGKMKTKLCKKGEYVTRTLYAYFHMCIHTDIQTDIYIYTLSLCVHFWSRGVIYSFVYMFCFYCLAPKPYSLIPKPVQPWYNG